MLNMFSYPNPKIIIKYARALDPIFIEYCKSYKHGGWDKWVSPSHEEVTQRTESYKKKWVIWQEQVIGGIQEILGSKGYAEILDVITFDSDTDGMGNVMNLLRTKEKDTVLNEYLYFYHCVGPSTQRNYYLCVPECGNVWAAKAYTFKNEKIEECLQRCEKVEQQLSPDELFAGLWEEKENDH